MITPKELDGIDIESIKLNEELALENYIDARIKLNPQAFTYDISAVGVLESKLGWEDIAKHVVNKYKENGWIISEFVCFFSFRTRVEFKIAKR